MEVLPFDTVRYRNEMISPAQIKELAMYEDRAEAFVESSTSRAMQVKPQEALRHLMFKERILAHVKGALAQHEMEKAKQNDALGQLSRLFKAEPTLGSKQLTEVLQLTVPQIRKKLRSYVNRTDKKMGGKKEDLLIRLVQTMIEEANATVRLTAASLEDFFSAPGPMSPVRRADGAGLLTLESPAYAQSLDETGDTTITDIDLTRAEEEEESDNVVRKILLNALKTKLVQAAVDPGRWRTDGDYPEDPIVIGADIFSRVEITVSVDAGNTSIDVDTDQLTDYMRGLPHSADTSQRPIDGVDTHDIVMQIEAEYTYIMRDGEMEIDLASILSVGGMALPAFSFQLNHEGMPDKLDVHPGSGSDDGGGAAGAGAGLALDASLEELERSIAVEVKLETDIATLDEKQKELLEQLDVLNDQYRLLYKTGKLVDGGVVLDAAERRAHRLQLLRVKKQLGLGKATEQSRAADIVKKKYGNTFVGQKVTIYYEDPGDEPQNGKIKKYFHYILPGAEFWYVKFDKQHYRFDEDDNHIEDGIDLSLDEVVTAIAGYDPSNRERESFWSEESIDGESSTSFLSGDGLEPVYGKADLVHEINRRKKAVQIRDPTEVEVTKDIEYVKGGQSLGSESEPSVDDEDTSDDEYAS